MAKKGKESISSSAMAKIVYQLFDIGSRERVFIILVAFLSLLCYFIYPYPHIAMWVGFMLAGYAAIANDSIQTIGTFIASNKDKKWYYLWLFMGVIYLVTVFVSWQIFDGDVSYQRLQSKGFDQAPTSFTFLQLAAPLVLLILTRMRMPVSTTFLLLNVFSTEASAIVGVIWKSLSGYLLAFSVALIIWFVIHRYFSYFFKGKPSKYWVVIQWITSGLLWSVWVQQDAANIAIFLPRNLNTTEFVFFASFIFFGLGLLFYLKGDKIQGIVDEKTGVRDVRAATIVDFVYCILLYYKLFESKLPMSTTWLFIGLLGGRELAISITRKQQQKRIKSTKRAVKLFSRDLAYALIGLFVSLILALSVNDQVRDEVYRYLFH
ncbi:MAG: hypothetical protein JJU28_03380 [Cyclobacteriaceae bacterium]|nr:hypothetical protein [Cyclobacteriaceae bacterium]